MATPIMGVAIFLYPQGRSRCAVRSGCYRQFRQPILREAYFRYVFKFTFSPLQCAQIVALSYLCKTYTCVRPGCLYGG